MQAAPNPPDEALRVADLLSYNILDTEREKGFDILVELIAEVCDCEYALIAFVDSDRHWFKASKSIAASEVPRGTAFCSHTILGDEVMVVKNTRKDRRFADGPHVAAPYNITFYAGAPITSAAGYRIGTVCAMDQLEKLSFTAKQERALQLIAQQVAVLLELKAANKSNSREATRQLDEEKKMGQLTMAVQDEEQKFIAYQLQENLAQSLSASKFYLDSAALSEAFREDFIRKSKETILQVISEMKLLSKAMVPSSFDRGNYLLIIEEMLAEYGRTHNKMIVFRKEGTWDQRDISTGLTLFRIISYRLADAQKRAAENILVTIKAGKKIRLRITDDGKIVDLPDDERKHILHQIKTRVRIMKGKLSMNADAEGIHLLEVELNLPGGSARS